MSASSSCRSSSRARSRSPPLRTSAPTCVWPSSTWHLHRLSSSLRPASHLHPSRPLGLQPHVLNRTSGGFSGNGRGRRRCGGRGQGGSNSGSPGGSQWPSLLNPWTGSIHMWPGATPGGPRGPPLRTGPPPSQQLQQHALVAGVPPTYYPSAPGTYQQVSTQAPHPQMINFR